MCVLNMCKTFPKPRDIAHNVTAESYRASILLRSGKRKPPAAAAQRQQAGSQSWGLPHLREQQLSSAERSRPVNGPLVMLMKESPCVRQSSKRPPCQHSVLLMPRHAVCKVLTSVCAGQQGSWKQKPLAAGLPTGHAF